MLNIPHMRMQYEILNRPIAQLALENNLPINMLQKEAEDNGWQQWWPESDVVLCPDVDQEEKLVIQSEAFLDRTKHRLAAYSVAKEVFLAQKYFQLETAILDAAIGFLEVHADLDAGSIHDLGSLYKNLSSTSVTKALTTMTFGEDEGGMPTVIIKDLSGTHTHTTKSAHEDQKVIDV